MYGGRPHCALASIDACWRTAGSVPIDVLRLPPVGSLTYGYDEAVVSTHASTKGVPTVARSTAAYNMRIANRLGSDGYPESTGKERDADTGLDYFGARYFSGAQGRFTTPDPVVTNRKPQDPQLWNKYAYVGNRPLTFVDPDGKWPSWIHNSIIDTAFGRTLSRADRRVLQAASAYTDRQANQDAAHAYQHGMSRPGQSPADAQAETRKFITGQIDLAVQTQVIGEKGGSGPIFNYANGASYASEYAYDAMFQLGQAVHAGTDSFSPTHAGAQTWSGHETAGETADHIWGESRPFGNEAAQARARQEARRIYDEFKKRLEQERKKIREQPGEQR